MLHDEVVDYAIPGIELVSILGDVYKRQVIASGFLIADKVAFALL